MNLFDNNSGAEFSKCGKYRYKLWRIWNPDLPLAMGIGLNPSTANADKNDQTICYLIKMLTILGYGGFYMMNLFALISPEPKDLLKCEDALGDNDYKLKEVELLCKDVIVCWGGFPQAEKRIKEVLPHYPNAKCFGVTQNGRPFHPLAMMPRNGRDAQLLPTPTAQDGKNNGSQSQQERNTKPLNALMGGKLNPQFVEAMMGFPIGWTELKH